MVDTSFRLSTVEYEALWSELDHGRMPYPLDVPSTGVMVADRDRIRRQACESLRERGLFHRGRLDPVLWALLGLLGRHRVSVDAVGHDGVPLRALAASDGRMAVLGTMRDGELTLTEIRPTAVASAIAGVLSPATPGPGRSLSVGLAELRRATDPEAAEDGGDPLGGGRLDGYLNAGIPRHDAELLAELSASWVRGGQFGVTATAPGETAPRRGDTLVGWLDTDKGRYLAVREGNWISFAPADNDRIAARIERMLSSVEN
ncbi:ESX secretion-associated protein EspG [Solihabitans fulvus]|uniref:ESX secretion-associated protein EspG n=2 Tax=Solihabitans fulvus TaxID=1892852 RepID=A0A5B2XI55_9PSEU|nr:ESX secretion-associated protein EspG [Solihabitans fulvus]